MARGIEDQVLDRYENNLNGLGRTTPVFLVPRVTPTSAQRCDTVAQLVSGRAYEDWEIAAIEDMVTVTKAGVAWWCEKVFLDSRGKQPVHRDDERRATELVMSVVQPGRRVRLDTLHQCGLRAEPAQVDRLRASVAAAVLAELQTRGTEVYAASSCDVDLPKQLRNAAGARAIVEHALARFIV